MIVVTVNGRRVLIGNNATVALLLKSLGYPARGIAVALKRAVLPRPPGKQAFPTGPDSSCLQRYRLADSPLTIAGRSFTSRLIMARAAPPTCSTCSVASGGRHCPTQSN
jgi:sulfur carrier protein ThiS